MRTSFRPEYQPSAREVRETFTDEIRSLGGRVIDEFEDNDRFIGRAVLSASAEIRPGDIVNGGIAVRAGAGEILVHPYTFRQVCTNGAISAHALGTLRIERLECTEVFAPSYETATILAELAGAVRVCAVPESFMSIAAEMRLAADTETDVAITMSAMLSRWPQMARHFLPAIFERFTADGDRSKFGFMNAITSVARDTRDPDARWELEKLGGGWLAAASSRGRRPDTELRAEVAESSQLAG